MEKHTAGITKGTWRYRIEATTISNDLQKDPTFLIEAGEFNLPIARTVRRVHPKAECEANARLMAASKDLLEACKAAAELYDHMALSPLEAAAKYGDNYEPPTDEDCLQVRQDLHDAISKAEGQ